MNLWILWGWKRSNDHTWFMTNSQRSLAFLFSISTGYQNLCMIPLYQRFGLTLRERLPFRSTTNRMFRPGTRFRARTVERLMQILKKPVLPFECILFRSRTFLRDAKDTELRRCLSSFPTSADYFFLEVWAGIDWPSLRFRAREATILQLLPSSQPKRTDNDLLEGEQ